MDTPICDFVKRYADSRALRLHMPGHKGAAMLGPEAYDITEIDGADSLYEADGIIRESENNAGSLFQCQTFYSTEGSSLCIRAMLYLTVLFVQNKKKRPLIAAGRNAHKTFLSAAALLDLDVLWLCPEKNESYLSCTLRADRLERIFKTAPELPDAVYLTSPDYLGNTAELRSIAEICHKYGVLLLVDNAHGAYLKFLPHSRHPIDLGADLCCDSAHKTLPVLTGGAYLHVAAHAPEQFAAQAKNALALFGSTSPSYLILQSLDLANRYLCDYPAKLASAAERIAELKQKLLQKGFSLCGEEPLKLTVTTKPYGYRGTQMAELLAAEQISCEFADPDFLVMMFTPENGEQAFSRLENVLLSIPQKEALREPPPEFRLPERVLSIREAAFSDREKIPAAESIGRILAAASVGCPPAVPITVCGERIDRAAAECFAYYGIKTCDVVKEETR